MNQDIACPKEKKAFVYIDLTDSNIESIAKWLSCNGEVWGVGPTAVFASAAALFLYHELESTIFIAGDGVHVSLLEKTLISTMIAGMLALMIHLWVCSMRFFQYYLDTLIRDSPNMLLEMTTAGLLGTQADMVPLGPLTRFLRQQQPQIHITVCWFLSLCYADYVRKNYCQRFNMPYLEQWQAQLHERASRGVKRTIEKVNSFVGSVHQRLRGFAPATPSQTTEIHTVRARYQSRPAVSTVKFGWAAALGRVYQNVECPVVASRSAKNYASASSVSRAKQQLMRLRNSVPISLQLDVRAVVHRSRASAGLAIPLLQKQRPEDCPWKLVGRLRPRNEHTSS